MNQSDLEAAARESPILSELIDCVGFEAMMGILDRWGGVSMYVPKSIPRDGDHDLVRAVGLTAAKRLSAYYGGDIIAVPAGTQIKRLIREANIAADHGRGLNVKQLARQYGHTEKHIRKVLRRMYALEATRRPRRPVRPPAPAPKREPSNRSQLTLDLS